MNKQIELAWFGLFQMAPISSRLVRKGIHKQSALHIAAVS